MRERNQDFATGKNAFVSYKQIPTVTSKKCIKRLILKTLLYWHLLLTMSSIPTSKLNNAECKKKHMTQRPPIPYATSKVETTLKASRETIKMKTPEGKLKMAVLGDSPGAEEYLQHLNAFLRMLSTKMI